MFIHTVIIIFFVTSFIISLPWRTQRALSVAIAVGYDFHKDKKTLLTLLSLVSVRQEQQRSTWRFSPRKRGQTQAGKREHKLHKRPTASLSSLWPYVPPHSIYTYRCGENGGYFLVRHCAECGLNSHSVADLDWAIFHI